MKCYKFSQLCAGSYTSDDPIDKSSAEEHM